ncbi:MAG: WecB/TagA/CpsF family glycosyltransferase [Burkholderiaceae bacterium]
MFVALGCPKQEKWVQEHVGRINAVMIGVGVAFDYYSGNVRRARAGCSAPGWNGHFVW